MTALSDALEQAQTRAVAGLAKQYVAGVMDVEEAGNTLESFGLTDRVDALHWFACLDAIREYGSGAPAETNGKPKDPPATDAQLQFISKLLAEKNVAPDDFPDSPLTKAQAHEIIDSLQAGAYEAAKWKLPF